MFLSEDSSGNLSGNGGYPVGGNYQYSWVVTSGKITKQNINFKAKYISPYEAMNPETIMNISGTISSEDGTMSGKWSDNYQGGSRAGNFFVTQGM